MARLLQAARNFTVNQLTIYIHEEKKRISEHLSNFEAEEDHHLFHSFQQLIAGYIRRKRIQSVLFILAVVIDEIKFLLCAYWKFVEIFDSEEHG